MRKKLPEPIKEFVKVFMVGCPICGSKVEDKRATINQRYISPLMIRSWTKDSVTRECMRCGLRFNIRWVTLCNAVRKICKDSPEAPEEETQKLLERVKLIEHYFRIKK